MSTLTQRSVQPAVRPLNVKGADRTPALDVGKVKIVPLPRRNDAIYMRTLRRRRA